MPATPHIPPRPMRSSSRYAEHLLIYPSRVARSSQLSSARGVDGDRQLNNEPTACVLSMVEHAFHLKHAGAGKREATALSSPNTAHGSRRYFRPFNTPVLSSPCCDSAGLDLGARMATLGNPPLVTSAAESDETLAPAFSSCRALDDALDSPCFRFTQRRRSLLRSDQDSRQLAAQRPAWSRTGRAD
jgi:hypothetical protein